MEHDGSRKRPFLVINAHEAAILLQIKHKLPLKSFVNVWGKVTAVSEIMRINKDNVFVVELEGKVVIVVKQIQFRVWHQQLKISSCYVFSNLRPTSLSRSYTPHQRVFVPWTGSEVKTEKADASSFTCLSLQNWLVESGIKLCLGTDEISERVQSENDGADCAHALVSYQAKVTDVKESEFQMFTLDGDIRLFLGYMPSLEKQIKLGVGDCISLQNVHQRILPTGEKQLFCCVKSSIHVVSKKKDLDEDGKVKHSGKTSAFASPFLWLLARISFSPSDIEPLIQLCKDTHRLLGSGRKTSESKESLRKVLRNLLGSVTSGEIRARNYMLEFCQHHTLCPLNQAMDDEVELIPRLSCVTELLDSMKADQGTGSSKPGTSRTEPGSEDQDNGWTCHNVSFTQEDGKQLVGWLTVSGASGHLQLCDQQSAVDIVTPRSQEAHKCSAQCDCGQLSQGEGMRCLSFNPCCSGQLVSIKKFSIVTETFTASNDDEKSLRIVYLVLSPQDCVVLLKRTLNQTTHKTLLDKKYNNLNISSKPTSKVTDDRHSEQICEATDNIVHVTLKHHMGACEPFQQNCQHLSFCVEGTLISTNNCSNEQQAEAFIKDNTESAQGGCCVVSDATQRRQPVSMTFEGTCCGWYPLVHAPGLYRLVSGDGGPSLLWPRLDSRLQAAMDRGGTRAAVKASPSARLLKLWCDHMEEHKQQSLPGLQSALSDGTSGLLSFTGMVKWRRHTHRQLSDLKAGDRQTTTCGQGTGGGRTLSSLLGTSTLCVGVQDRDDPSVTATVYFNSPSLAYPLGLLPGVSVDFHRLDRKMSRGGMAYFAFLPVSALHLVSGPENGSASHKGRSSIPVPSQPSHWDDAPTQLLVSLWQDPSPRDVFVAACHVSHLFRLSLKSVCLQCGAVFAPSGCSAPACSNRRHSQLMARISVLVEDGSCQALVTINKRCPATVAPKLLTLTSDQWRDLEVAVQHQGELFLQKFGQTGGTAVEDLLSLLCDSGRVKRLCWLLLRKPAPYDQREASAQRRETSTHGEEAVSALQALTADALIRRTINTGEARVETLCLPYLQLECLDVREM